MRTQDGKVRRKKNLFAGPVAGAHGGMADGGLAAAAQGAAAAAGGRAERRLKACRRLVGWPKDDWRPACRMPQPATSFWRGFGHLLERF